MEWLLPTVVGLASGGVGVYIGLRIGITRLEIQMASVTTRLEMLHKRSHNHNEDLLIHDIEMDEVMRRLELPRARRQKRREE
jgi:hypothetical protein